MTVEQFRNKVYPGFAITYGGDTDCFPQLSTEDQTAAIPNAKNYRLEFFKKTNNIRFKINKKLVSRRALNETSGSQANAIWMQVKELLAKEKDNPAMSGRRTLKFTFNNVEKQNSEVRALYAAVVNFCQAEFGLKAIAQQRAAFARQPYYGVQPSRVEAETSAEAARKALLCKEEEEAARAGRQAEAQQSRLEAEIPAEWSSRYDQFGSGAGEGVGASAAGAKTRPYYLYPKPGK